MAATETTANSPSMAANEPLWAAQVARDESGCGSEEGEEVEKQEESKCKRVRGKKPTSWHKSFSFLRSRKLTCFQRAGRAQERIDRDFAKDALSRPLEADLDRDSSQASHLQPQCDIMRSNEADNFIRCSRVAWLATPHTPPDHRRQKLHWPTTQEGFVFTSQEEKEEEERIQRATTRSLPPPPPQLSIAISEERACNYANAIQVPTPASVAHLGSGEHDASKIRPIPTPTPPIKVRRCHRHRPTKQLKQPPAPHPRVAFTLLAACLCVAVPRPLLVCGLLQNDPRPTIYSGQVSFGLLLSAHSSPGSDLTSAAAAAAAAASSLDYRFASQTTIAAAAVAASEQRAVTTSVGITGDTASSTHSSALPLFKTPLAQFDDATKQTARDNQSLSFENDHDHDELLAIASEFQVTAETRHGRRQIFERPSHQMRRQQQQQQVVVSKQQQQQVAALESECSQANPSALYAGMSAIWASHQANLVGDSQLAIGTYVYDSCNDLEIGQRQSVRIVSNLNAFQQTTCESPRGSPISLTIAHGDNQLRAIQLLTSFKVPVITTREPFALEDYHLLTRDQRRYLFSTAPSSRHLAVGALKYTKRVVSRTVASPKLPNQHHRMSSKNGLIVISRNLPAKFITYLTETIPNHVNYEMLQSDQPIDQVRSVEVLESILMLNKQQSSSDSSTYASTSTVSPGGATLAVANSQAESRLSLVKVKPEVEFDMPKLKLRRDRSLTSDDSEAGSASTGGGGGDQDDSSSSTSDQAGDSVQQMRMLSPTILMFITPSEAIDLVTRLRNDLAEVSRYYSLVVATREDISPALRTIFHRGGSRLCSGKAFYTISPQPDEVHEFSRYFRDTVQMEGQSSDHPLICEFAKHQSSSRSAAPGGGDLDDIAAEAVIKAVWSAAAAFKLVHKRECGAPIGASAQEAPVADSDASSRASYTRAAKSAHKQGRRQSLAGGNQTSGASQKGQSECMAKMSKNMSHLVQRALRKLDVTINSTGLQALDGFRIKFDESNELLTSKFSIKYINRECEITELGQYSGAKDSQLHLDEDTLAKSLESTVPDPWPITAASSGKQQQQATATSGTAASRLPGLSAGGLSLDSPSTSEDGATGGDSATATAASSEESPRTRGGGGASSDDEHDSSSSGDSDKLPSITLESDSPKRRRSNSAGGGGGGGGRLAARKSQQQPDATTHTATTTTAPTTTPVSMPSGRGLAEQTTTEASARPSPPASPVELTTINTPTTTTNTTRLSTNGPSLPALMRVSSTGPHESGAKPMRELKPFPGGSPGAALKEWLPKSSQRPAEETSEAHAGRHHQQVAVTNEPLQTTSTTQAPVYSTTLPESGGNTDLEMPAFKASARTQAPASARNGGRSSLETAASAPTETSASSSDYVTLPSIVRQLASGPEEFNHPSGSQVNATHRSSAVASAALPMNDQPHLSYLRDLSVSPVPLTYAAQAPRAATTDYHHHHQHQHLSAKDAQQQSSRTRLRSHLKWIYGSWFTLTILGANICGALFTLYVLTFLLMKNCDGSLDRENQSTRSMHLLAIIVVFFGSTLFIVYPTPSLCLLRTSWHNFALVLVFGSLLLQTMQTRSISSLGLGGRPNRLNQFLTLVFMVGVQVSFELQRWKYESANYINFINQYFNSQENGEKKLVIFGNSISGQFNPLNSFNDQVTPVSIQLSEKYQSLLHDYCTQPIEDYLQSQIYLWIIIGLLIVFSITGRQRHTHRHARATSTNGLLMATGGQRVKGAGKSSSAPATAYNLTSGKLLASQHETNEFLPHKAFSGAGLFSPTATATEHLGLTSAKGAGRWNSPVVGQLGNVFVVTLISAPIYLFSVVMYVHGQELASPDLVASVSMVLIAFVVLIGTFMPLMRNYHKYGELSTATTSSNSEQLGGGGGSNNSASSLSRPIMSHHHQQQFTGGRTGDKTGRRGSGQSSQNSPSGAPFLMFPEFAATGLRRPSSMGGESNSGGTRRPFAETKESRRNMGLSLANLPEPLAAADSLRNLCVHNHRAQSVRQQHLPPTDYSAGSGAGDHHLIPQANLNNMSSPSEHHHHRSTNNNQDYGGNSGSGSNAANQRYRKSHGYAAAHSRRSSSVASSSGEKRLIMLDVDPCCPRHGLVASTNSGEGPS